MTSPATQSVPSPLTIRERFGELIRFGMVGGLSTVIYLGVYSGLVWAEVGFALAALVAFGLSTTSGFFLHHRYTFAPTRRRWAAWRAGWHCRAR